MYICYPCWHFRCKTRVELEYHIYKEHPEEIYRLDTIIMKSAQVAVQETPLHECNDCDYVTDDSRDMSLHISKEHSDDFMTEYIKQLNIRLAEELERNRR